jgi:hypothetical protein
MGIMMHALASVKIFPPDTNKMLRINIKLFTRIAGLIKV